MTLFPSSPVDALRIVRALEHAGFSAWTGASSGRAVVSVECPPESEDLVFDLAASADSTVRRSANGNDQGEVGALVLMTLAFAGWVGAAISFGENRMWFFVALSTVVTLAALAMTQPPSPRRWPRRPTLG